MKEKIAVQLVSKDYLLVSGRIPPLKIRATVHFTEIGGKKITLLSHRGQDAFKFIHSELDVAEGVIALMQKAVEVAKKEAESEKPLISKGMLESALAPQTVA